MKKMLAALLLTFAPALMLAQSPSFPVQFSGQYLGKGIYWKGAEVTDKGIAWFSLADNNKGHTPDKSPTWWVKAGSVFPPPGAVATPPVPPPPPTGVTALINHTASTGPASAPIPTTGANFAQACVRSGTPFSDNMGNTWEVVPGTAQGGYSGSNTSMVVAYGLKTSATHTFSTGDGSPFTVTVFSNVASGPDQVAVQGSPSNQHVGPITTGHAGELSLGCFNGNMNPPQTVAPVVTANAPYKVLDIAVPNGAGWPNGVASAYAILTAPTATEIDFDSNQRNGSVSVMASFYSAAAPIAPSITIADALPEAAVGVNYPERCPRVAGGMRPFGYVLIGTLPPTFTYSPQTGCIASSGPNTAAVDVPFTIKVTDLAGASASVSSHISVADRPITMAGSICPEAKQLQPYTCTALQGSGGIGPLHYSASTDPAFQGMPGNMNLDPATGVVSSPRVMDQGVYDNVGVTVSDSHGGSASASVVFPIAGDNTFGGAQIFPKDTVFHLKVRDLPNDTSIRSMFPVYYQGVRLRAGFGQGANTGGFPIHTYAPDTPFVSVKSAFGGNQFTSGPIPCNQGVEGDRNQIPQSERSGSPDVHSLGFYRAPGGPASAFELYNVYPLTDASGGCSWGNPLDPAGAGFGSAVFPNLETSYSMPNGGATVNAGGTPLINDLVKYDELAGGCPRGHECGKITHTLAFTVERLGQFFTFPGTATAPVIHDNCPQPGFTGGDIQPWDQLHPLKCYDGNGAEITTPGQTTVVAGMIFHLPPTTPEPAECASVPVNHILFTALVEYGAHVTDNGLNGNMLGTKDDRYPDWGTLNSCLNKITLGQMVAPNVGLTAADPTYRSSKILSRYVTP